MLLNAILVSGQTSSSESLNAIEEGPETFGLTAYGEPCSDDCKPRGFPYTWCHKIPSRNGTWIDRDYCSPAPGVTRYLEPCLDACAQRDQPFFWCKTRRTKRGDWDYCSPFGTAGTLCSWSEWGPWSQCSPDCGPKSSRTRRRRFETETGKVGPCSGEIEQSISQCTHVAECSGRIAPFPNNSLNFSTGNDTGYCLFTWLLREELRCSLKQSFDLHASSRVRFWYSNWQDLLLFNVKIIKNIFALPKEVGKYLWPNGMEKRNNLIGPMKQQFLIPSELYQSIYS